jgi:Zn-ribbon-containing, possibly nucleic-acid-binding protein (DUF2310)
MDTNSEKQDKPIPAKIILTLKDEHYTGEAFIGLSGTLYQERLVWQQPNELRKIRNNLEFTVTFGDTKSFESWLENEFITKFYEKHFNEFLIKKPETIKEKDLILELDRVFNCSCESSIFYLFYGRRYGFTGELNCGNCLGNIPYSKIPATIKIEQWQRHHERVYRNWLDSEFLEGSSTRQLTNYKKGILNKEGEKIRKELAEFFNTPVYIEYFVDQPPVNQTCVICDGEGTTSGLKSPNRICKKCNTSFSYSEK